MMSTVPRSASFCKIDTLAPASRKDENPIIGMLGIQAICS